MIVAALAGMLSVTGSASAETWTVTPSLSVGAIYDDNLFFDQARLAGAGLRAGPVLSVELKRTTRLTLLGRAGWDSEYFGDPAVSSWSARRSAGVAARYRLGTYTTASLSGDYSMTAYAAELLPTTGVEFGRRTAESFGSKLELEHRLSPKVVVRLGGGMQTLQLERAGSGLTLQLSSDAEVALLLTPHTTLRVQAGPRYLDGSYGGHVGGTLERARPRTRMSVSYERGRSLVFDRVLVVEGYAATFSYRLSRALVVSASPALFRQWERAVEQRSWHISETGSYRARSWLTVFVNHAYVVQDGGFFVGPLRSGRGRDPISRNTLTAGFTLMPQHFQEEPKP